VRRRSGHAQWSNEHSNGSRPHGFLLNPEERKHLRRQLREQGGGNRSEGIAPVQGPQHSAP
jgi:hypothetical protein